MADEFRQASKRLPNIALAFFAFVGFIASAVTVIEFFSSKDASALSVEVYVNRFLVPLYPAAPLQSAKPARTLAESLRSTACSGQNEDAVIETDMKKIEALEGPKEKVDALKDCKNFIAIEFAARWSGEYSQDEVSLYEYNIENVGDKIASDIRVQAKNINSLQYKRGDSYVEVKKTDNDEYFKIPDLNPREKVRVLAWGSSKSYPVSAKYIRIDDIPSITFSGQIVETELYKPVTGGWYNLYEMFRDSPIMLTIFIILGSFLVVFSVLFSVSVVIALTTGRPLSEVFNSGTSTKSSKRLDDAPA